MRNEVCGGADYVAKIDEFAINGTYPAEIEQAGRDRFAAKGLAFDQAEIFRQVIGRIGLVERAFVDPLFERFGTGGDRRQRIIYLVDDTGGQPADRGEFFGPVDRLDGFDPNGDVLADGDDMRHLAGVGVFHRHLADHPVQGRAVIGDRLLLDTLNLAGAKCPLKFLPQPSLRIFFQHVKNVAADGDIARYALRADLAMPVPCDDPIIAVDNIERNGQSVQDGLGKFAMLSRVPR